MSFPLYLAISPEEKPLQDSIFQHAYLGHQLAKEAPALLCPQLQPDEGSYMILQDNVVPTYQPTESFAQCIAQYAAQTYRGIICDFEQSYDPFYHHLAECLAAACEQIGIDLWVPKRYDVDQSTTYHMVSSAVLIGDYYEQISRAAECYPERTILELQPLSIEMVLPDLSKQAIIKTPEERETLIDQYTAKTFYAPDLCCNYFSFWADNQLHIIFYDTTETIQKKLEYAKKAGCCAAIGLRQELKCLI